MKRNNWTAHAGRAARRAGAMGIGASLLTLAGTAQAGSNFELVILHHNDGESQLINAGSGLEDFGGIARFATVVDNLRAEAALNGQEVVTLTSGDNFLAGPEFNASLDNGVPYFDTIGLDLIGYDAMCLGNHDFDFGPQILANFIDGFTNQWPFLSANLDFSAEPVLQTLVDANRIAPSTIVVKGGEQIGIIGATTPNLPFISSPGDVVVDPNVVGAIQTQVGLLQGQGVNKIIVISHLQSVQEDIDLIANITGVDVVIAGGGDNLLANPGDLLVPGDSIEGPYPTLAQDMMGETVYVVTGKGDYRYVGRLIVEFDAAGDVVNVDPASGPVRVAGGAEPDAVTPDPTVQTQVVDPVSAFVASLATDVVANSDVPLNGVRNDVRSKETNFGNLIADSQLWQARQLAGGFGIADVDIALQNGGGIRNDSILPAGPLSVLDTFDALPFLNFVAVIEDVPALELLDIMENAVSRVEPPAGFPTDGTGRFAQVAGMQIVYNVKADPGARVRSITLDDGTPIVQGGQPALGAPTVNIAIADFLARGGDEYPIVSDFQILGATYQQALENYLEDPAGLNGQVTAADYPEGGEGRIVKADPDLTDDDLINADDLMMVLGGWGPCSGPCPTDLNGDGVTDAQDLFLLLGSWTG